MYKKMKLKFVLSIIALVIITSVTIFAQPKKDRGVKTQTTTPTSQNEQISNNSVTNSNSTPINKKRLIVILDFDDGTNTVESQKRPVGRQVAIMLADEFARAGNFTIIEREKIEEVLAAQNKTLGNRFDPQAAAKIGKVLSAQTVVLGTIIEYTTKRVTKGLPGFKKTTISAKVGATIRLVDVNTGVVLDSVTVNGEAEDVSTATVFTSKDTELSDEVKTSLLTAAASDASKKAEDQLTKLIDKSLATNATSNNTENTTNNLSASKSTQSEEKKEKKGGILGTGLFGKDKDKQEKSRGNTSTKVEEQPNTTNTVANNSNVSSTPRIAVIDGQDVYVKNLPTGTKVGTRLIAYEIGKVIKDSETGEILKQEEKVIAELEIVSMANNSFICKVISGQGLTTKTLIKLK